MTRRRRVTITLLLPPDLADQVEAFQAEEPEYFQRVVEMAVIRKGIYRGIRDRQLAENSHPDGGAWERAGR